MGDDVAYARFLPSRSLLFSPDQFDRDLVRDFLFAFSRAEYALKTAGFLKRGGYDEPKIEWRRFAETIAVELDGTLLDEKVLQAREYLSEHPPDRQVFPKSGLQWQPRVQRPDQTNAQFLIESVTQVRNNLFHGGKELMGRLAERDRELVEAALIMVVFAVSLDDRVSALYLDAGPRAAA